MAIITAASARNLSVSPRSGSTQPEALTTVESIAMHCSTEVLKILGLADGLVLRPAARTEAILAVLAGLTVVGTDLFDSNRRSVAIHLCLGLLNRLGLETKETSTVRECLNLCERLGAPAAGHATRLRKIFALMQTPSSRLRGCISRLESRGYHVRTGGRLSLLCHPVSEETADSYPLFGLRSAKRIHETFAMAA